MTVTEPVLRGASLNGATIRYLYYEGEGPDMVFMHATGFGPWQWHPIAREFAGGCRVIVPFFYEHRYTAPGEGGVGWDLLAGDLRGLWESLGLERPVLIGHSIGATLVTLADAMGGSAARKMVLFEPIFLPEHFYGTGPSVEQHPMASKAVKRGNHWNSAAEATAYFRSRDLFRNWDEEMMELYVTRGLVEAEGGGLTLACTPLQEAALFMGDTRYNPWPRLRDVDCPVLVVEGETSEIGELIDCLRAAAAFRRGSHRLVRGAGHLIPMEKPLESIRIIREFI